MYLFLFKKVGQKESLMKVRFFFLVLNFINVRYVHIFLLMLICSTIIKKITKWSLIHFAQYISNDYYAGIIKNCV